MNLNKFGQSRWNLEGRYTCAFTIIGSGSSIREKKTIHVSYEKYFTSVDLYYQA